MTPEFSRPVRLDTLGSEKRAMSIEANEEERRALAARFGLQAVERLSADASLTRSGDQVTATGRISAKVVQSCVATDVPVDEEVDEPFRIEFRPQPARASEEDEIELSE